MHKWYLDLQLFTEGPAAAGADGGDSGEQSAEFQPDTVLEDGTRVDRRLADRLNKQAKKHPDRFPGAKVATAPEKNAEPQAAENLDAEWAEAKKGKFAAQYGRDVQAAVNERFKNQADANKKLDSLTPMHQALMKKYGVESVEQLQKVVLDDDSLYEEEAEERGMSVESLKAVKRIERENELFRQREQQSQQQQMLHQHYNRLAQQADRFKQVFPGFDLDTELQNPNFLRLTGPNVGLSVEDAFYAVHHNEINPQIMAAGISRAKTQISQSIQANGSRPVEGAMSSNQAASNVSFDPHKLTKAEREEIRERVRRGEKISF